MRPRLAFLAPALVLLLTSPAFGSTNVGNNGFTARHEADGGKDRVGGQIVFSNDPGPSAPKQLYLERADGTGRHQLVHSTDDDVQPTISPDGTEVVFTRMRITSNGEHETLPDQIFTVGVDGKGLHQIIPSGCPKSATCGDAVEGHAYSPDGKRLVFTRAIFRHGIDQPPYVELWTANLDGSHALRLTHEVGTAQDDHASWSPNGKKIVFLHWIYGAPDQFRIATVNTDGTDGTDGTDLHLITPAGLDAAHPIYSPQGDRILFQSPPDPLSGVNQVLYTVRPDGSRLRLLSKTLSGVASNSASWSPNGRQILFCHIPANGQHGADLYLINRNGTDLHPLARTPLLTENDAYWGNDPRDLDLTPVSANR
jgi:Tol biopolymer transport system component